MAVGLTTLAQPMAQQGALSSDGLATAPFAIYFVCILTTAVWSPHARLPEAVMDRDTVPHGPIWLGATVLLVDDEPMSRTLIRRMLEHENFHVEEAANGEVALGLVQSRPEPFDLVLTDLSMPGIDGRQLSETLARYRPAVALLGMSGNPDAVPHVSPSDAPFRVMLKPFTADDLYHAIRDALTRSASLAAAAEDEIVRAHAGLSKLARALEASRTVRVNTLNLVVAARELRRVQVERRTKPRLDRQ